MQNFLTSLCLFPWPILNVTSTKAVLIQQHSHFELNGKGVVVVMGFWLSLQYENNSLIHSPLALLWLKQHSEPFFRFFLLYYRLASNFARQFQSPLDGTENGWVFSGRLVLFLIHRSYQFLLLHTFCVNADGVESRLGNPSWCVDMGVVTERSPLAAVSYMQWLCLLAVVLVVVESV